MAKEKLSASDKKMVRIVQRVLKKTEAGKPLTKSEERFMKRFQQPRQSKEDRARLKQLSDARNADELGLAGAIVENLFAGLPEELRDFEKFFGQLPKISKEKQKFLMRSDEQANALVKATSPYGEVLASRGLTVLDIFTGINAIELLLERGIHRGNISTEFGQTWLSIHNNEVAAGHGPLSGEVLVEEIFRCLAQKTMAKDEQLAAKLILLWIAKAACYKLRIFNGFLAKTNEFKYLVYLTPDTYKDLEFAQRWNSE